MKKVILFLGVIGATLLMTSCLGEGSNNYTDQGFVYLGMDDRGTPYGIAVYPDPQYQYSRWITNNSMISMLPGTIKYMAFSWDEERGTTPITIDGQSGYADNVDLIGEPADIDITTLRLSESPVVDEPVGIDEIVAPVYLPKDLWVIQYAYTVKKGEKAFVEFYKRNEENEKGEIVIDIRLTLSGTPEGDSSEKKVDVIAVDLSPLRNMYGQGSAAGDELKIRFNYYKTKSGGEPEETESQNSYRFILGSGL